MQFSVKCRLFRFFSVMAANVCKVERQTMIRNYDNQRLHPSLNRVVWFKDNHSCSIDDIPTTLYVHGNVILIHI